jgi:hypothetical protein
LNGPNFESSDSGSVKVRQDGSSETDVLKIQQNPRTSSYNENGMLFGETSVHEQQSEKKSTAFSFRKDVIIKTIFRFIRKFYVRDFKSYYDFTRCIKSENSETTGKFIEKLTTYAACKFPYLHPRKLSILLLCVIDTKERYSNLGDDFLQIRDDIGDLLYSYNKKKFTKLMN